MPQGQDRGGLLAALAVLGFGRHRRPEHLRQKGRERPKIVLLVDLAQVVPVQMGVHGGIAQSEEPYVVVVSGALAPRQENRAAVDRAVHQALLMQRLEGGAHVTLLVESR